MAVLQPLDAATYHLPLTCTRENAILDEIYNDDMKSWKRARSKHTHVKQYVLDQAVEHANRYRTMTSTGVNVNPLAAGPLFDHAIVNKHLRTLFPSTPTLHLGDSDVLCKYAIVHLLRDDLNLIIAFCINALVTCKNGVGITYMTYSFFDALNIDNQDGDIAIQVALTDVLIEQLDTTVPFVPRSHSGSSAYTGESESVITDTDFTEESIDLGKLSRDAATAVVAVPFDYQRPGQMTFPNTERQLYKHRDGSDHNITKFLHIIDTITDPSDKISKLSNSIVGFIAAHRGESQALRFANIWSVKLICTYLDLLNELQGSGQGLLAMFLISIIEQGGTMACLELARLFLNITGLCAYSKFGFVPNVNELLLEQQQAGDLFNDPNNLQMSVVLTGPIAAAGAGGGQAAWVAEIIRRLNDKLGWHKHEVCRFRQVQCDLPNRDLFGNAAPSAINNLQVEAAVVSIMRNHLDIMITCLQKGLTVPWRVQANKPYSKLYNAAKDGLAPGSFGSRFDETNASEYYSSSGVTTPCYARVNAFYRKVVVADNQKQKKLSSFLFLNDKLKEHYDLLLAANDDTALMTLSAKVVNHSAAPRRVIATAWNTREQRFAARDARATDRAMAWWGDQAHLGPVMEEGPGGAATPWEPDDIPSDASDRALGRVASTGTLATERPLQVKTLGSVSDAENSRRQAAFDLANALANANRTQRLASGRMGGGKKQTKNKRKKNKLKTKRRAANKKNKKAQHGAGRVSRHNKVFRRKTRRSK